MHARFLSTLLGTTFLFAMSGAPAVMAQSVTIDDNDIGGVVTSGSGPEAGVWVIAETYDLPTRHVKIVVTDDQGRYVLPDMQEATYQVWVRGYGLVDSDPVDADPGTKLNLTAKTAPTPQAAAEVYPAHYWFSLIENPAKSEFPGTGPEGNGISPAFATQQDWIGHVKEQCHFCHQLGNKITRTAPDVGNTIEAWDQRVQKGRSPDDIFHDGNAQYAMRGPGLGSVMNNNMTRFGRQRGLSMFADWTDRIAAGEVPVAPERPEGVERNIVVSVWDWGGGRFIHDAISTDKRNPTVHAGGEVFGVQQLSGMVATLDPSTSTLSEFELEGLSGDWNPNANDHTSTIDSKGRHWMSNTGAIEGKAHEYCTNGDLSPWAALYPKQQRGGQMISVFDPETKESEAIPVCFGTHHLNFTWKSGERLYYSGDTEVVGWIDVDVWDKTKDPTKAVGWCPLVLDTNGDGKITQDRNAWNVLQEGGSQSAEGVQSASGDTARRDNRASFDPNKDTRVSGFNYANGVSPVDDSYWVAKYTPAVPSGILRLAPNPQTPEDCLVEYYEAPLVDGEYLAYNARGTDVDKNGIVWVGYGTGKIGRFDRSQCKVVNGPTAHGQHCPEGWTIYDTPGPKMAGTNVGTDYFYQAWVDHFNASGLGENIILFPNSAGDELLAFNSEKEEFIQLRLPYPLGFYPRGLDARIDDPDAGWKGRGVWSTNAILTTWHQEGGEGSSEIMTHFQVRPNPLAH